MHDAKIFVLGSDDSTLVPMAETPFAKEELLQALLAGNPDLLPGDQIDPDNPRRWLLVKREMGIPGEEGGGGRWSLDHLLLDQDAVPIFVECKRASDTRSRREVVAQMLDYAANAIEYWSMDRLRQSAAETASKKGKSLDDEIRRLLGDDEAEIEPFWQRVEDNLRSHRVRLIFVTDETPRELRRLVEFLNKQLLGVEVLAVEVKQFRGQQGMVVVSRVVGLTETARDVKAGRAAAPGNATNRPDFLARCPPGAREFFKTALDSAEQRGLKESWGGGSFSLRVLLPGQDKVVTLCSGYEDGRFFVDLDQLAKSLPAPEVSSLRDELRGLGVFEVSEAGKAKVGEVDAANADRVRRALGLLLDKAEEFRKKY